MMNLNLKQPLVLPAHQSNVVIGSRLASSSPSAAAVSSRRRGGVSSRRHSMRISCSATEEVSTGGAVSSVTVEEKLLTVRATVEASPAIGQMYFERALDDVRDLLGKTLLLELVSSDLDASE